jgi:hypothetical protein
LDLFLSYVKRLPGRVNSGLREGFARDTFFVTHSFEKPPPENGCVDVTHPICRRAKGAMCETRSSFARPWATRG